MPFCDKIIKNCRLCGNSDLDLQINLGEVPLGNNILKDFKKSLTVEEFPLSINKCKSCRHFQLSFSVSPKKLYAQNYSYLSGIGKSFLDHLEWSKNDILNFIDCDHRKIKILDIGSNDGTALKYFKNEGVDILGVDPAELPAKIANENQIPTINKFFSEKLSNYIKKKYGKFDVIISHNVLAHVEDINDVFNGINNLLENGGYLIFEIGYFGKLIRENIVDTIYHEHLDYHTKYSLANFLVSKGFSVLKIIENEIQGGSLRIYCKKDNKNKIINDNVKKNIDNEIEYINENSIRNWEKIVKNRFIKIRNILLEEKHSGKNLIGYGAPTKATLYLKNLDLNFKDIKYIVEDNKLKVGGYLPKTGIPIISSNSLASQKNNFIICFAWNFFDDIYCKLKEKQAEGILFNILTGEKKTL